MQYNDVICGAALFARRAWIYETCSLLQHISHTNKFLYDPLFRHYRLLNGLSAGHVRGYRHARATSLYTIIVCSFPGRHILQNYTCIFGV